MAVMCRVSGQSALTTPWAPAALPRCQAPLLAQDMCVGVPVTAYEVMHTRLCTVHDSRAAVKRHWIAPRSRSVYSFACWLIEPMRIRRTLYSVLDGEVRARYPVMVAHGLHAFLAAALQPRFDRCTPARNSGPPPR